MVLAKGYLHVTINGFTLIALSQRNRINPSKLWGKIEQSTDDRTKAFLFKFEPSPFE